MILLKSEIEKEIVNTNIVILPYDHRKLNPNSYNVSLHNELLVYDNTILDLAEDNSTHVVRIPERGLLLRPNELYLGRTVEYTETNGNLVPMLEGRSSLGRLGIFIHVTAGFGDVGFRGYWTLEIKVVKPTIIYPNIQIGQLYFHEGKGDAVEGYNGKYQDNNGIQASKMFEEMEKINRS